jgi:hypothetical protein
VSGSGEAIEKVVGKQNRPTVNVLVAAGAFAMLVLTGFLHLSDFVKTQARELIEPVAAAQAAEAKQLSEQDERQRQYEKDFAEFKADFRALKEDVHFLRERAGRAR